mgnify:CR=1 FL=1
MKHARRRVESEESFGLRDTLIWCGIPIVIVLLVRMFLFGFYVIPSGSMLNTIEPGDRVITSKLTPKVFKLQRGDVVVFKDPDHWLQQENSADSAATYLIKRLIGLPGDDRGLRGARQAGHGQRCGHRRNFVHPLRRGPQLLRVQ